MKKNGIVIGSAFTILLSLLLTQNACKHAEDKEPITELYGKVCLINSDTPVPHALVRFLKEESGGLWEPVVYIEVGNDTTDVNGNFVVPRGTGADLVRAYGPQSIYDVESQDVDINNLWQNGGNIRLSLIPPAWVKAQAIDAEPLNPEVVAIQGDTAVGSIPGGEIILSSGFRKWKVKGNITQQIQYRFVYENLIFGNIQQWNIPPLAPFDTTEITITY
jgi:hypothetical protein